MIGRTRSLFILGLTWMGPHLFFSSASQALDAITYSQDPKWRKFEMEWLGKPVEGLMLGDRTFRFMNQQKRNVYTKALMAVVAEMEKNPPRGFCVRGGKVIEKVNGGGCKVQSSVCEEGTVQCDRIFHGSHSGGTQCVSDDGGATTLACVSKVKAWTAVSNHLASPFSKVQWVQLARGVHNFCDMNSTSSSCAGLKNIVKTVRVPGRGFDAEKPPMFFKEETLTASWKKSFGAWPELLAYILPEYATAQTARDARRRPGIEKADKSQYECKIERTNPRDQENAASPTAYSYWGPGGKRVVIAYAVNDADWESSDPSSEKFLKLFGSGAAGPDLAKAAMKAIAPSADENDAEKFKKEVGKATDEEYKRIQEEIKQAEKDRNLGFFSPSVTRAMLQKHQGAAGFMADFQAMRTLLDASGVNAKVRDVLLNKYYGKSMFLFMQQNIHKEQVKLNAQQPEKDDEAQMALSERTDGMRHLEERDHILQEMVKIAKATDVPPAALHVVLGEMDKALKGTASFEERIKKLVAREHASDPGSGALDQKMRVLFKGKPEMLDLTHRLASNTVKMIERQKAEADNMVNVVNDEIRKAKYSDDNAKSVTIGMGANKGSTLDLLLANCSKKQGAQDTPVREPADSNETPFQSEYDKERRPALGR